MTAIQTNLLLADRTGRILTEASPIIESISEGLNKFGRATLRFSTTDAKATAEYLAFGNRILIQFDNGLPDWGGFLDTPRAWLGNKSLVLTAYSGERLFDHRITEPSVYFSSATVGQIFQSLIQAANATADIGLRLGSIWLGGVGHSPDYHLNDMLNTVQTSLLDRLSNAEFAVKALLENGRIIFEANLYERRGVDMRGEVALVEGANVVEATLREDGTIGNYWIVAGADISGDGANGWGDGRLLSEARDNESISAFGMRQRGGVFNDITSQETLDNKASNALKDTAYPRNIYDLRVADTEPGLMSAYGIGDIVTLQLETIGFGGTDTAVRVYGREITPTAGTARLIVDEVTE